MVFQEQSLLPNLSVAENIMLGYEKNALRYGVYNWRKLNALASAQLAKLDTKVPMTAQVESLPFADRQVVEIAKVLTIAGQSRREPIILLDEPTSVLEAEEVDARRCWHRLVQRFFPAGASLVTTAFRAPALQRSRLTYSGNTSRGQLNES